MQGYQSTSAGLTDKAALRRDYLQDILAPNRTAAMARIMAAFRKGCPVVEIYKDVFHGALYEIGHLWETNRITVAQEHTATAITQFIMANLYQHLSVSEGGRGRMVITGVQGEFHQVGANMVADVLESDGWDVMFLGTNVPSKNVVRAVREHRADLLGISVALLSSIPALIGLVSLVRQEFGEGAPRILLGGGVLSLPGSDLLMQAPELAGCLLARNLDEALELTRAISTGAGKP
ncbi:MAG: cobalamin-dependent protein [Verrucomicrobiota bacterium]